MHLPTFFPLRVFARTWHQRVCPPTAAALYPTRLPRYPLPLLPLPM